MTTEQRKPREWWLIIENDDPSDIAVRRSLRGAEEEHGWLGTARTHIVHVREVLEDSDGKG